MSKTITKPSMGRRAFSVVALGTAVVLSACGGGADGDTTADEAYEEELESVAEPLFDASTIDETAKQALLSAGAASVLSQFDPLGIFAQVEYCGLIVKKANGTYRAGAPVTQYKEQYCSATIGLAAGERVVGYYHSHTPASITGFSTADKTNATNTGRQYYVISTVNGCAKRYNPTTKATTSLGCFPNSL